MRQALSSGVTERQRRSKASGSALSAASPRSSTSANDRTRSKSANSSACSISTMCSSAGSSLRISFHRFM